MKSRQGYKGYVIEARSCELKDGGFSAEFSVEEHDADGVMETEFYLPEHSPRRSPLSTRWRRFKPGNRRCMVFERGRAVVNG